ncbi:hypothetical protein D7X88_09465 [bacterium C-53]|nr:hypothetical protein [Lachnospiraceae bacterium]NBI03264.1 hypothetical protein [Lachnospiraceae bacterium]RKJ10144.1 hypothetical protein D7X88_09465 [bacterium C-53]
MNVALFNTASNRGNSIFEGNLPMMQRAGLKSVQEKAERQQKAQSQITFWENQKESLKNMECNTPEDIMEKLGRFHSYESEISAVKMQYNQEQMWHAMDEAREIGEKIAEGVEKFEPKTAEERREDIAEEALGTDENKGELTESMEKMQEEVTELTEEIAESTEEMLEDITEESVSAMEDTISAEGSVGSRELLLDQTVKYQRINILI